jgi:flagellin
MKINYNVSAMIANNALKTNDSLLADSIERLSSGLKIANAKDNPSGLAMSRRMNSQIKSLNVAGDSSNDGISVIETADGALSEIHEILQRMNELAIQAANGTVSSSDRKNIQDEIDQLKDEIDRIAESTQFNGQNLLDGSFDLKGYSTISRCTDATTEPPTFAAYETDSTIKVNSYSDKMDADVYTIGGYKEITDATTGVTTYQGTGISLEFDDYNLVTLVDENGYAQSEQTVTVYGSDGSVYMENASVSVIDDLVTIKDQKGHEIELKVTSSISSLDKIQLDLTAKGAMTMQVGANEGQTLDIRIPRTNLSNLGLEYVDFTRTIKEDVAYNVSLLTADDTTTTQSWNSIVSTDDPATTGETSGYKYYLNTYITNNPDATDVEDYQSMVDKIDEIAAKTDLVGNAYSTEEKIEFFASTYYVSKDVQETLDATIADTSLTDEQKGIKIYNILATAEENGRIAPYTGVDEAIQRISDAINEVSSIRSRLGAYENRLEHTTKSIDVTTENMTAAYSRIMDVDMAEEMTVYSTQQVLSQAGTSMLAQANERPSQVLTLLQ